LVHPGLPWVDPGWWIFGGSRRCPNDLYDQLGFGSVGRPRETEAGSAGTRACQGYRGRRCAEGCLWLAPGLTCRQHFDPRKVTVSDTTVMPSKNPAMESNPRYTRLDPRLAEYRTLHTCCFLAGGWNR